MGAELPRQREGSWEKKARVRDFGGCGIASKASADKAACSQSGRLFDSELQNLCVWLAKFRGRAVAVHTPRFQIPVPGWGALLPYLSLELSSVAA